ncbi:MAG: hypothetical protein A4E65_02321 [Syntrophorhabdus sp. PtaU1.Bin153]|nr:MAG: hypothetical protein A4E65_02321 [Syntrophorhabdus sp. PtaU1.Bin153]
MPAAIPVAIALAAAAAEAMSWTAFFVIAAMSAANFVITSLSKPGEQDYDLSYGSTRNIAGININTESSEEPLPLIYGRCKAGINRVFRTTSGEDNKYLHIIGTICEGPILGVVQVDGVDQIWLGDKLWNDPVFTVDGESLVYYEIFTGTNTQLACTTLQEAYPPWDEAMRYTAYIYLRLKFDRDVFQTMPKVTMLIDGLLVYNPDTAVTEYSNNPALCARDFITRSARRGGMGIASARLDDTTFIATGAYCDTKAWTIGLPITEDQAAVDNLSQILSTFRGSLVSASTLYKLKYRDLNYETTVMDVTEDEVVCSETDSSLVITQPSIFDTPNAVCVKFLDEALKYEANDFIFSDQDLQTSDGDYREETITIKGINKAYIAGIFAYYHLERLRYNKIADFAGKSSLMSLEPMDLITLTHSIPGWDEKVLRVESVSLTQDGGVQVSCSEEDDFLYDDAYTLASHSWVDTQLASPSTRPPAVDNATLTEELYYYRDRSFTRLKVDFDAPNASTYPYWDHADVYVQIGSGGWRYMTTAESDYMLDPVNEGQTYGVKLVSVNIWGVKQKFEDAIYLSKTVDGKTDVPADLAALSAVASGDTVSLFATELNEPDLAGYEVRIGASWSGATLIGFGPKPFVRLVGVKPGTFTFWMAAKDNGGHYSATPKSATVTVFYPPNYVDKNTWSWDYSTGNHSNTEKTTYDGNNVVKCSHDWITGDNLITNGDFDTAVTGWTATANATVEYDASGFIGGGMKVTAAAANVGAYQDITVAALTNYRLKLHYKNTAGDLVAYRIYDNTHSVDIISTTNLASSTSWSAEQAIDFSSPTGCTSVRIYLYAVANGDIVWLDEVECYQKADVPNLVGTWLSPEYDLGSIKTVRVWGDFVMDQESAAATWAALFGLGKWSDTIGPDTSWADLVANVAAAQLSAKIYWGDTSGNLSNSADFFQITAPEFTARYVQVEVTITDPNGSTNLYVRTLNMKAAYWS